MIDDAFVVDATVHGWSVLPENRAQPYVDNIVKLLYYWATEQLHPRGNLAYQLTFEFFRFGEGAAAATLLLAGLIGVAIAYLWWTRREEVAS